MTKSNMTAQLIFLVALFVFPSPGASQSQDDPSPKMIRKTVSDLRLIATAAECYRVFHDGYPVAYSIGELAPYLAPFCVQKVPRFDAWGNEFVILSTMDSFEVVSLGSDGMLDESVAGRITDSVTFDFIVRNGEFVQCPKDYCDACWPELCSSAQPQEARVEAPGAPTVAASSTQDLV